MGLRPPVADAVRQRPSPGINPGEAMRPAEVIVVAHGVLRLNQRYRRRAGPRPVHASRHADGRSLCNSTAPRSTCHLQLRGSGTLVPCAAAGRPRWHCVGAEWWVGWKIRNTSRSKVRPVGAERGKGRLRKQDKGRRDSQKSPNILMNSTEYPRCGGGILRQLARASGGANTRRIRRRQRAGCPCRRPHRQAFAALPSRCCVRAIAGGERFADGALMERGMAIDLSWIGSTRRCALCSRSVNTGSVSDGSLQLRCNGRVRPRSDSLPVSVQSGAPRPVGHSGPRKSK